MPESPFNLTDLVRQRVSVYAKFPAEVLDSLTVEQQQSFIDDTIAVRVRALIYGETLPSHTETRHAAVPASPWQHFKHDHARAWWMRPLAGRRPPLMKQITLTATWQEMAGYPWASLKTQLPDSMGPAVRLSLGSTTRLTEEE